MESASRVPIQGMALAVLFFNLQFLIELSSNTAAIDNSLPQLLSLMIGLQALLLDMPKMEILDSFSLKLNSFIFVTIYKRLTKAEFILQFKKET